MSTMRLGLSLLTALLTTTLFLGCTSSPTTQSYGPNAQNRVALVIGNAKYKPQPREQQPGQLILGNVPSASKDAKDMTTALQESGFTVYKVLDGDRNTMIKALEKFGDKLDENTVGFFYFSGHGLEVDDETYLIPTDVNPLNSSLDKETLTAKTVTRSEVYEKMEDSHLNLVILDACRNSGSGDETDKGVVAMMQKGVDRVEIKAGANTGRQEQMPKRTILVYATGDGHTAAGSSSEQQNSLYTKHLLKFITEPGLSINQLFDEVSRSVEEDTKAHPLVLKVQIPKKAQGETSGVENSFRFRQGSAKGGLIF